MNVFEVPFVHDENGQIHIDFKYYAVKFAQFAEVFPHYDFLGWYTNGSEPTTREMYIHRQMMEVNPSALFVQIDTNPPNDSKDIPVRVFETITESVDGQSEFFFTNVPYILETEDSERIAVDYINHSAVADASRSQVSTKLAIQQSAISMLASRIKVLHQYVEAVIVGEIDGEPSILRDVASLCQRLPVSASDQLQEQLTQDYTDVQLVTYLATITKGANVLSELVSKANIAHGRRRGHPSNLQAAYF